MQISARVKPGSKQPGLSIEDGVLTIRVRERAVEGAANEACVRALAQALGIAPGRIALLHGARSRQKRFAVEGMGEAEARSRLGFGV